MRESLFRGKRIDNGEWVESISIHYPQTARDKGTCWLNGWYENANDWMRVDPKTVGQYTGLTDKNGKKLFEGDIVKTQPFYDKPYSDKRKSKCFIGVVKYKVRTFNGNRFYAKQDYHGEWGLDFCEELGKYTHYSWGELWNCEIIGNIHDNKELVKGGAE